VCRDTCAGVAGALRIAAGLFEDFIDAPGAVSLSPERGCDPADGTPPHIVETLRRLSAKAGHALAAAEPAWLPVEFRSCGKADASDAGNFAQAISACSWLVPGPVDVYDFACGSVRVCRMAAESIEAYGNEWGTEPEAACDAAPAMPLDSTAEATSPEGVVSVSPEPEPLGYGEMQSILTARLKNVRLEAMDAAVGARRGENAHLEGDAAVESYRQRTATEIARDLVEARDVAEPRDHKGWDRLRNSINRAIPVLGWDRCEAPAPLDKAQASDITGTGSMSRELDLGSDIPSGYRRCPACTIGIAGIRDDRCSRCLAEPNLVGIAKKSGTSDAKFLDEAREQALDEWLDSDAGRRASVRSEPK
jgi:hypothetical protein